LWVQPNGNLISFDITSLFMKVPIRYFLNPLSWQFDEVYIRLFHHILTSSFFCFNGQLPWAHSCYL
jgi:hypothetical protein